MTSKEISTYVDSAMYEAEPMPEDAIGQPKVHLISATPDPLGTLAAACRMFEGKPTQSLDKITDEERRHYWAEAMKTSLKAPLEFIQLHFFIEGVTRSFTHQMVRQRTAVYAQESMRFAVKDNFAKETPLPPSLQNLPSNDLKVQAWNDAMDTIQDTYNGLIANGIPGEDARGLLPHQTTTRLNYATNLRGLAEHAGNRLCTQAQFEWRLVFLGIMQAIHDYNPGAAFGMPSNFVISNAWQFKMIAQSELFRPVCFAKGNCGFMAAFDRGCTIRGRVDENAKIGRPSRDWDKPKISVDLDAEDGVGAKTEIEAIHPMEWLGDPTAGFGTDKT